MPYSSLSRCATTARSCLVAAIDTTLVRCTISLRPTIRSRPCCSKSSKPVKSCSVKASSCARRLAIPRWLSQRTPAASPMIPGRFSVPASNLSGIKRGVLSVWLRLPVPPTINGASLFTMCSRSTKPPIPCGPSSPLCPVKAKASICICCILIGKTPALWALSTIKSKPLCLQKSPTLSIGSSVPQTLLAWVIITALVRCCTSLGKASSSKFPSLSQGIRLKLMASAGASSPASNSLPNSCKGRITALCSMAETSTWSPGCSKPRIITFKASVTFLVNTTFLASSPPKKSHSSWRAANTASSAA